MPHEITVDLLYHAQALRERRNGALPDLERRVYQGFHVLVVSHHGRGRCQVLVGMSPYFGQAPVFAHSGREERLYKATIGTREEKDILRKESELVRVESNPMRGGVAVNTSKIEERCDQIRRVRRSTDRNR